MNRDYEKEYWEAQEHIDKLEAENERLQGVLRVIANLPKEDFDRLVDALLPKEGE